MEPKQKQCPGEDVTGVQTCALPIYNNPVCQTAKETQMYRAVFWTLWERERVGCGRMALKHV